MNQFPRSVMIWILPVLKVGISSIPLVVMWYILISEAATRTGQPIPGGWTWLMIIALVLFLLWLPASILWYDVMQIRIRVTEGGIWVPGILGSHFASWGAVKEIEFEGTFLVLITERRRIDINLVYFRRAGDVTTFIEQQVSAHKHVT